MNNEPVNPYKAITDTKIEPTVVSYTHPVKELTDEEIKETIKPIIFMKQIIEALAIASVAGTVFFILVMWALAAKYVEQQYFGY